MSEVLCIEVTGFFFLPISAAPSTEWKVRHVVKGAGELGVRFTLKGSDWWKTLLDLVEKDSDLTGMFYLFFSDLMKNC